MYAPPIRPLICNVITIQLEAEQDWRNIMTDNDHEIVLRPVPITLRTDERKSMERITESINCLLSQHSKNLA